MYFLLSQILKYVYKFRRRRLHHRVVLATHSSMYRRVLEGQRQYSVCEIQADWTKDETLPVTCKGVRVCAAMGR